MLQFNLVGPNTEFGYVGDIIDNTKYNNSQIECISRGRGNNNWFGIIDDLNPKIYIYFF